MITNITKSTFFTFFIGNIITWGLLVSFQQHSAPKAKIKTKTHKIFDVDGNATLLKEHTKTTYNIHGEVIEQAEYKLDASEKTVLEQLKLTKYNRQGLYIGSMVYNSNNALIWSEEYNYNEYDQVVKITQTNYTEHPAISYTLLAYDSQGNVILSQTFDQKDHQTSEQKRNYATTGELLTAHDWYYIPTNNKPIKRSINIDNQYNSRGQIVQSTQLLQEGKDRFKDVKHFKNSAIVDWIKYKNGRLISHFKPFTKDTNMIQQQYLLPPPIPEQHTPLEYDDSKRDPLENIPHETVRTVAIKNNKQGLPQKKVTRFNNQITEVIYYYYNDLGLLQSEKIHHKIERTTEEIQYEYDSHQNLIQQKLFIDGTLTTQHLLQYEYYHQK